MGGKQLQKSRVNKVILVGHIGNKPEGRYTPAGTSTANFSLATNESWIDSDKEKKERTEWHTIVAWNKLADFATEFLQKGQLLRKTLGKHRLDLCKKD